MTASSECVVGFDVNPVRVAELRAGRSGIEDLPDAAVAIPGRELHR